MREERFAGITVRLTGGEDRQGGGDGPLVVLMHGFGAPGTDLVGLWRVLDVPSDLRFAFPEAPHEIPGMFGARAWWMVDFARAEQAMAQGPRSYATEIPPGMEDATDRIVQMIQAIQQALGVPSERLVVGGFSQGSMAACNAVFTRNVTPGGLVILSGTPVNVEAWKAGMATKRGMPVFQSHGHCTIRSFRFRPPSSFATRCETAGLSTEWVPFRGGHEIPMPVLEGLGRFLSGSIRGCLTAVWSAAHGRHRRASMSSRRLRPSRPWRSQGTKLILSPTHDPLAGEGPAVLGDDGALALVAVALEVDHNPIANTAELVGSVGVGKQQR